MPGGYMSGRIVHVDQLLSQMAINYRPQGFIADQVFPTVTVMKQTDLYLIFEQADLFRADDTKRSRGTEAQKISYRTSSASYFAENYALKADVTLEDRLNADPAFVAEFEQGRTRRVLDKLLLAQEVRVSSLCMATASVGSSAATASAWDDPVNANPLIDAQTVIDNVEGATGYRPNRLLFGGDAWRHFRRNNNVKNAAINMPSGPNVSGGGKFPSTQEVAALLEVEEILVGRAFLNSAQQGIAQTLARIWPDSLLAFYAPAAPSTQEPSFGYKFRWAVPGLPNMQVERHPFDSRRKVDELEIGYYQDEVITATALGFLLTNVLSSGTGI